MTLAESTKEHLYGIKKLVERCREKPPRVVALYVSVCHWGGTYIPDLRMPNDVPEKNRPPAQTEWSGRYGDPISHLCRQSHKHGGQPVMLNKAASRDTRGDGDGFRLLLAEIASASNMRKRGGLGECISVVRGPRYLPEKCTSKPTNVLISGNG